MTLKQSIRGIRAVLFDVFGTVVDWRSSISQEVVSFAKRCDSVVDGEAFADRWRALYQPAMERVRSGSIAFVPLDQLHRENLDQTLMEFSLTNASEAEIANLNLAWHRLDPWPDVVPGLQKLKRGYQIGTLSNGNIDLIKNMARHAGLPWDAILGAEVARAYKPQPQAYLGSAAALGFEPSQCMLVAAHNNDLEAALEVGFKTAFVARPFEHGPNQETDLFAEGEYEIVAQDFIDLAEQLGC